MCAGVDVSDVDVGGRVVGADMGCNLRITKLPSHRYLSFYYVVLKPKAPAMGIEMGGRNSSSRPKIGLRPRSKTPLHNCSEESLRFHKLLPRNGPRFGLLEPKKKGRVL